IRRSKPTMPRGTPAQGKMKSSTMPTTTSASATPITSSLVPGGPPAKLQLEDDDLLLGQLSHGVRGPLARVARVLAAAVRHLVGAEGRCLVDRDAAEVELLRRPQGGSDVRREDPRLQAV